MHQNVCEERLERKLLLIREREHDARDRNQGLIEFRILHVLEHDALRTFLFHHALIVRQVEGRGLHAAVAFAGAEDFIDHADRRGRAKFGIVIPRIDGQMIFQFLQVRAELFQLRRFGIVAQRHVRFEPRLVSEQFIFVGFVRAHRHVDWRIKVHPGHVAVVIIV